MRFYCMIEVRRVREYWREGRERELNLFFGEVVFMVIDIY